MSTQGLLIQIPGVAVPKAGDPAFAKFFPEDARIVPGSLALIDFSNNYYGTVNAVPAAGSAVVTNVAWKTAAAQIGAGSQATLACDVANTLTNVQGKMELTTKKGLHGIYTQAADTNAQNFVLSLPALIRDYILNNSETRNFFFSAWMQITRSPKTGTSGYLAFTNNLSMTSNYEAHFGTVGLTPASGSAKRLGAREEPATSGTSTANFGRQIRNIGVSGFTGSKPGNNANSNMGAKFGRGWGYGSAETGNVASWILYQLYVEELYSAAFPAGRTYAEADAADYAAYTAAFAAGGRFNGDTFTDPATLP